MKTNRILLTGILAFAVAVPAILKASDLKVKSLGFVAPTVVDKSNVYDPKPGEIVYDQSDSTFYGRTHSGTWNGFNGSGVTNGVISDTSGEKVVRLRVFNTGSASIVSQSGSWVSAVSLIGTGSVHIDYDSSTFSDDPTCVCTTVDAGMTCNITSLDSDSMVVRVVTDANSNYNSPFSLICMGPN